MYNLFPHPSIFHCKKIQGPQAELAGARNSCLDMGWDGGAEPVFVDLLRSPGIDSQIGGPVRLPYFSHWLAGLAKSIPWNRFLGFINVYKYGLSCPILQSNASTQHLALTITFNYIYRQQTLTAYNNYSSHQQQSIDNWKSERTNYNRQ